MHTHRERESIWVDACTNWQDYIARNRCRAGTDCLHSIVRDGHGADCEVNLKAAESWG